MLQEVFLLFVELNLVVHVRVYVMRGLEEKVELSGRHVRSLRVQNVFNYKSRMGMYTSQHFFAKQFRTASRNPAHNIIATRKTIMLQVAEEEVSQRLPRI